MKGCYLNRLESKGSALTLAQAAPCIYLQSKSEFVEVEEMVWSPKNVHLGRDPKWSLL